MIIGLGGTNGAGKDLVAEILAQKYGYLFVGATELFTGELQKRGWELTRTNKAKLSAEWRRELGMAAVVDKALAVYRSHPEGTYKGLVVSSLRHPGEVDRIHEVGGSVIWIDAEPEVRYQRIRSANRGRSAEDDKTFEEFLADEQREMTPEGDGATLNMLAVKERADNTLWNNFSDREQLEAELAKVIAALQ